MKGSVTDGLIRSLLHSFVAFYFSFTYVDGVCCMSRCWHMARPIRTFF